MKESVPDEFLEFITTTRTAISELLDAKRTGVDAGGLEHRTYVNRLGLGWISTEGITPPLILEKNPENPERPLGISVFMGKEKLDFISKWMNELKNTQPVMILEAVVRNTRNPEDTDSKEIFYIEANSITVYKEDYEEDWQENEGGTRAMAHTDTLRRAFIKDLLQQLQEKSHP